MSRRIGPPNPPFVEVGGWLFLNLNFRIETVGTGSYRKRDADRLVLRPLTAQEMRVVRERRLDSDLESWAKITA